MNKDEPEVIVSQGFLGSIIGTAVINTAALSGFDTPKPKIVAVTDFGEDMPLTNTQTGDQVMMIPRYGVWAIKPGGRKPEVIDTASSLDELRERHGDLPKLTTIPMRG